MIVNLTGYIPEARFDNLSWTHARIEEASSAAGPWTAIETITLSPVDADPAHPATRSFTTTHATLTSGWYRVVWVDAALLESATPSVRNILSFASTDEFAARIGLLLTDAEKTRATTLLTLATGLIQDEAKQTISLVTDDTLARLGTTDERILLPELPVVSIASVTLNGVLLSEGGAWYQVGNELVSAPGIVIISGVSIDDEFGRGFGRGFGSESQTLEIVYTHGYADIPQSLKAICMEAVVRVWVNPGAVAREQVGNTMTVYDNMRSSPAGLLLTDAEKHVIRRMFGRRAKSLSLGGPA